MKKIISKVLIISVMLLLSLDWSQVEAAKFSVYISTIDDLEVAAFTVGLQVSDDFECEKIELGTAIPSSNFFPGWSFDVDGCPKIDENGQLKIGAADWGYLFSDDPNPLLNEGALFTLYYQGEIVSLYQPQFIDYSLLEIKEIKTLDFSPDGVKFVLASTDPDIAKFTPSSAPVPVPGALYLLSSGVLCLFAVRGKRDLSA